ncbi:MAG: ComF family protein [Dehalococcoidia bacterium]
MDVRLALRELTDALLPERCVVCERFGAALHEACVPTLAAADGARCARCWAPSSASPCDDCLAVPPAFEALRAPYRFEGAARRALLEAKFRGVTTLLPPLARVAAEAVPGDWRPSLVTAVPLHRARQRTRGYNQAGIAAEVVAERLAVPYRAEVLRRTRATAPQATLGAARRASNVVAAFAASGVAGERVLVVDDITTTGATLDACARALLDAGAEAVFALALARED